MVFTPVHPYATGVRVGAKDVAVGEAVPLFEVFADSKETEVRTRTAFGALPPHPLVTSTL